MPNSKPHISDIAPYQIDVIPAEVDGLKARLDAARWPDPLPVDDWTRGVPLKAAQRWAGLWRDLDWPRAQAELNSLPQFLASVHGDQMHFIHATSERTDAVPLLLLHGWPGSVVEFYDLINLLTGPPDADTPAFHVVAPSQPGVGFPGPTASDWDIDNTARTYLALMSALGYDRFVAQGGDHGAVVAPHVGRLAPERVIGVHVNAATIGFMPLGPVDEDARSRMSDLELARVASIEQFMTDGNGYNQIQTQRPATIGYGLTDSPIGLMTWMVEKFHDWVGDPAQLADPHLRDRVLTNLSVYWFTRTATTAANSIYRGYAPLFADPAMAFANSEVPTAVACFRGDISLRPWAEHGNTIVRWTDLDTGGHFAALEAPHDLARDLAQFVASLHVQAGSQ